MTTPQPQSPNILRFPGTITAISPLHHGGDEKTGSAVVLRSIMMYVEGKGGQPGQEVPMPYLSGNGIRGKLRRALMRDLFDLIGYPLEDLKSLKLFHVLFSGGVLESTDDKAAVIDLALRRHIRSMLPPLSLFGCAFGNQMVEGKLVVANAFPVCEEYETYLPDHLKACERATKPVRIFTDEVFATRRDDLRAGRAEDEQAVQMKISFECFVPGTMFTHFFALRYPTAVETSCFGRMFRLLAKEPFMGGKMGTGHGEVALDYQGIPSSEDYLAFVLDSTPNIREVIDMLQGML